MKVVDSTGIVIDYVYDAGSNMLEIKRSTLTNPGGLQIFSFAPQQGGPLATVTIQGQGFSPTASANVVKFNGKPATVFSATATQLVVKAPLDASSGPISVTVGGNSVSSPSNFTVLPVPVITSIIPKNALPNTTISKFQVNGFNLSGSTFTFVPALVPPAIIVGSTSINPTGTSATLSVTVNANASGSFVLLATNATGHSDAFPSSTVSTS